MHINIIRNRNPVSSIAVFTVVHSRYALALRWEGLRYLNDDCCLFPTVSICTGESQFFLSHFSLPLVGSFSQVAHSEHPEMPATNPLMVALTMLPLASLHAGLPLGIPKIVPPA